MAGALRGVTAAVVRVIVPSAVLGIHAPRGVAASGAGVARLLWLLLQLAARAPQPAPPALLAGVIVARVVRESDDTGCFGARYSASAFRRHRCSCCRGARTDVRVGVVRTHRRRGRRRRVQKEAWRRRRAAVRPALERARRKRFAGVPRDQLGFGCAPAVERREGDACGASSGARHGERHGDRGVAQCAVVPAVRPPLCSRASPALIPLADRTAQVEGLAAAGLGAADRGAAADAAGLVAAAHRPAAPHLLVRGRGEMRHMRLHIDCHHGLTSLATFLHVPRRAARTSGGAVASPGSASPAPTNSAWGLKAAQFACTHATRDALMRRGSGSSAPSTPTRGFWPPRATAALPPRTGRRPAAGRGAGAAAAAAAVSAFPSRWEARRVGSAEITSSLSSSAAPPCNTSAAAAAGSDDEGVGSAGCGQVAEGGGTHSHGTQRTACHTYWGLNRLLLWAAAQGTDLEASGRGSEPRADSNQDAHLQIEPSRTFGGTRVPSSRTWPGINAASRAVAPGGGATNESGAPTARPSPPDDELPESLPLPPPPRPPSERDSHDSALSAAAAASAASAALDARPAPEPLPPPPLAATEAAVALGAEAAITRP